MVLDILDRVQLEPDMNFNNYTIKAQEALQKATEIAAGNQQQVIETEAIAAGQIAPDGTPMPAGVPGQPGAPAPVAEEPLIQPPEMVGPVRPTPSEIIHQAFSQSPLQQHVDLVNRAGAVSVEISGSILFGLGSAAISSEGRSL